METMSLLFYARTSKANASGTVPIYLRVTIGKKRFETATGRAAELSIWSQMLRKAVGSSTVAKELNQFLETLRLKAYAIHKKVIAMELQFTIEEFIKQWRGSKDKPKMLLEIFQKHNERIKALVGSQYSQSTYTRYVTSMEHTRKFLAECYNANDINVTSLKYQFITDYEFWLKAKRKCNHNSTIKYLTNFKKIINICVKNGWLIRDPFFGFRMTKEEVDRTVLTQIELDVLSAKVFASQRLAQVRDVFLFSCYTGLSYIDTQCLSSDQVRLGIDGKMWIFSNRQKTDVLSRIPILPPAQLILNKYSEYPVCVAKNRLLPILSNQKMNGYIHEIVAICGISKNVTYHTARHTFATTITLNNGVPIETVSKLLGHKNIKTTQHYAKVLDLKLSADMNLLMAKFGPVSTTTQDPGL
ncbi:MAG: site-specific integrase [Chryseolinea sp.]